MAVAEAGAVRMGHPAVSETRVRPLAAMQPAKDQQRRRTIDKRWHTCGVFTSERGPCCPYRGVSEDDPVRGGG